jgi:hypothetical protein
LTDAVEFGFFLFDYKKDVKIAIGKFPFLNHSSSNLTISTNSPKEFIHSLRIICEIIFYILLRGYQNTLKVLQRKAEGAKESGEIVGSGEDAWNIFGKEEGRARLCYAIEKVDEAIRLATEAAEINTAVEWAEAERLAIRKKGLLNN